MESTTGRPIIIILGPTASGKTEVGLALAKEVQGEIISADSVQVYKYLDVGTAKPPREARRKIPHHLIDIKYPDEAFSAGEFRIMAFMVIRKVFERGRVPIVVGGTALYLRTITDGICPIPCRDKGVREHLHNLARKYGRKYLFRKLEKVDRISAEKIHPNNLNRIVRALEVYQITGIPFSAFHSRGYALPYPMVIFGLKWERKMLYERINSRVEDMLEKGLVEEVKRILQKGYSRDLHCLKGLGYRHVLEFLEGKCDWEKMVYLIKRDTRRYAKRQLTWWKKDPRIHWIEMCAEKKPEEVAREIKRICQGMGFLV